MLSPSSTGSPTTPSGMMEMMRPNSSMAQPHHGSYGSNGPSQLHQQDSRMPNGQQAPPPLQQQQYTGPPPYMMGPRGGMPNGGMRGHVPAPLNVPPIQRNLNGPLSHSSPRVIGAAGNVGGDYYWGSWGLSLSLNIYKSCLFFFLTIYIAWWHNDNRSNKSRSLFCNFLYETCPPHGPFNHRFRPFSSASDFLLTFPAPWNSQLPNCIYINLLPITMANQRMIVTISISSFLLLLENSRESFLLGLTQAQLSRSQVTQQHTHATIHFFFFRHTT